MDNPNILGSGFASCSDSNSGNRDCGIHACSASHLHENFREHEVSCINRARRKVFIVYSHKFLSVAHDMTMVGTQIDENTDYRRKARA